MKKTTLIFLILIFMIFIFVSISYINYIGSLNYAIHKAAECKTYGGVWKIKTQVGLLGRTIYYTDCTIHASRLPHTPR